MDGLLIVDKPAGVTSHDVVARVRRILGEPSIGHTGTLDPDATGVLPLVLGRATRLARFLSATDKAYDVVVRLGFATDTADASGAPTGAVHDGPLPDRGAVEAALVPFRGTYLQQPPAYSAKKIAGKRSYKLARATSAASLLRPRSVPAPSPLRPPLSTVVVDHLDLLSVEGDRLTLHVECSAGFYVRSLAHDLGAALGTGAHVLTLRRTRSGDCTLADAVPLLAAAEDPVRAARSVVPLAGMLRHLPSIVLTEEGVRRATHGRDLGPGDTRGQTGSAVWGEEFAFVRLLDAGGNLIGIAEPAGTTGLLHPSVVLV